jgi:predicted component of viral defense system (DUF524 family)
MRPDFTVAFTPEGTSEREAALSSEVIFIHFDSKYKMRRLQTEITSYLPDDLDKMHAYASSINHTYGAYALFPGANLELFSGPTKGQSVGALPISPGNLSNFRGALQTIISRLSNYAT